MDKIELLAKSGGLKEALEESEAIHMVVQEECLFAFNPSVDSIYIWQVSHYEEDKKPKIKEIFICEKAFDLLKKLIMEGSNEEG